MNLQDTIAIGAAAAVGVLLIVRTIRSLRRGRPGCGGCPGCAARPAAKRPPDGFVPADSLRLRR